MDLKDGAVRVGALTTVGRKSNLPRTVKLRLVYLGGRFYASSSKVLGKHWCLNMIKNPSVEIKVDGEKFCCAAKQIAHEGLRRRILALRNSPPLLDRVVFEMTPK